VRSILHALGVAFGVAFAGALARPLAAQQPATPGGATVSGTVYDSLSRRPFVAADVQLLRTGADSVPPERRMFSVATDSAGRYRLVGVPAGTYLAGFFHPALDSLGLQAPARQIQVRGTETARVDFGLPGQATLIRSICPPQAVADSGGLLFGFVRDAASGEPRIGATVQVGWTQVTIGTDGIRQEHPEALVHTLPNGWFAACGLPPSTAIRLRAFEAADTSGIVALDVDARQVVHRDFYVGRTTAAVAVDTTRKAAGLATRTGTGRLVGEVRNAAGRPVAGARVQLWEGADSAVTSEAGAFVLSALPVGSQTLDVRAVGYIPVHQSVDVLATEVPARVAVTLTSFKAYLDTVRVTRKRVYVVDRNGFEARRRMSAAGRFLTREAIERQRAFRTSDLFRMIPGVHTLPGPFGSDRVVMRGTRGDCSPEIYLDGMSLSSGALDDGLGMSELEMVSPEELDGVEVYTNAATAPPEYSRGMRGCGSIVMWTHPPDPKPPKVKAPSP